VEGYCTDGNKISCSVKDGEFIYGVLGAVHHACNIRQKHGAWSHLGGVVVSVLSIRPEFRGFIPGRGDGF
jgi:hypothetical protein